MSLPPADPGLGLQFLQITRDEYARLVQFAQRYDTLCRNLVNGGVQTEIVELLSTQCASNTYDPRAANHASQVAANDPGGSDQVHQHQATTPSSPSSHVRPYAFLPYSNSYSNLSTTGDGTKVNDYESTSNSTGDSENDSIGPDDGPSGALLAHTNSGPIMVEPTATRTVQLLNLAEGTTIADVTSVVRGGLLVNIYFRARDNTVSLSFLHSGDAQAFYHYVQANGLYIKNTKVDIKWDARQFIVAGHVAHKIALGACRNLVIQRCNPNLTEQEIRNDLEHIHNLVVIQVQFIGRQCFISTNSVAAAMFARTCMMSRLKYKGASRIDWGIDECAQPLHKMSVRPQQPVVPAAGRSTNSSTSNRFQLLSVDDQ